MVKTKVVPTTDVDTMSTNRVLEASLEAVEPGVEVMLKVRVVGPVFHCSSVDKV